MPDFRPKTENLIRSCSAVAGLRSSDPSTGSGGGRTMFGHFAVFNEWTEINSKYEGNFMERVAPGAFARAITSGAPKVLYDHGHDIVAGTRPLGTVTKLEEDKRGAYYEVDLFDATYVNDLIPALRAGEFGASFRFSVVADDWHDPKQSTASNPKVLPERTLLDVSLPEFGPTTFGAYAGASAGMRSDTDLFLDWLSDPLFVARLTERSGLKVVERILASLASDGSSDEQTTPTAPDGPTEGRALALALNTLQQLRRAS